MVARVLADSETQDQIGAYLRSKGLPLTVENYNRVHEATIMDNPEAWLATTGAMPRDQSAEQAILQSIPGISETSDAVPSGRVSGPAAMPSDTDIDAAIATPRRSSRTITNESVRGTPPAQPAAAPPAQQAATPAPAQPSAASTPESGGVLSAILGYAQEKLGIDVPTLLTAAAAAAGGVAAPAMISRLRGARPGAMASRTGPGTLPPIPPSVTSGASGAVPPAPAAAAAATPPPAATPNAPPASPGGAQVARPASSTTALPTGAGTPSVVRGAPQTPAPAPTPEAAPIELTVPTRGEAANQVPTFAGMEVRTPQIFEALGLNPAHMNTMTSADLMSRIKSLALSLGVSDPAQVVILASTKGKQGIDEALLKAEAARNANPVAADAVGGSPRSKTLAGMEKANQVPLTDAQGNPVAALSPMGRPRGTPTENVVNQPKGPTRKAGASAPPVEVTRLLGDTPGTAGQRTSQLLDLMRTEEAKVRANAPGAMSMAQFNKLANMVRDELGVETRAGLASAPMVEARLASLPADKVNAVLDQLFIGRDVGEAVGASIGKKVAAPGAAETATRPDWQNKLGKGAKPPGVIPSAPGTVDTLRTPKMLEQKPPVPKQAEPVESAPIDNPMDIRNASPTNTYNKSDTRAAREQAKRPTMTAAQKKAAVKNAAPVEAPTPKAETPPAAPAEAPKRGRGRPPGSKNKPKTAAAKTEAPPAAPKQAKTEPPAPKAEPAESAGITTAEVMEPVNKTMSTQQAKDFRDIMTTGGPKYQAMSKLLASEGVKGGTVGEQIQKVLTSKKLTEIALRRMYHGKGALINSEEREAAKAARRAESDAEAARLGAEAKQKRLAEKAAKEAKKKGK